MQPIGSIINKDFSERFPILKAKIKGFTKVPNPFVLRQDLNIFEKMIVIVLKVHQMNKGMCWLKMETISKEAGCSETTAKETINKLISKGLVVKRKIKEIRSNVYEVKV